MPKYKKTAINLNNENNKHLRLIVIIKSLYLSN